MMRIPGKIPITIQPAFWIFAALIGYLNSGVNFLAILFWVLIIFVSVLFHEMGHAVTALLFGRKPQIELVALGGLTYHDGEKLPFWKQFLIVFNGPLFGFILVIASIVVLKIPGLVQNRTAINLIYLFEIVNFFWTVLNLLPVMPLDGGQLLRIVLEKFFGVRGLKYALVASMVFAAGLSLTAFLVHAFLLGALFFLFAYQGFDAWRRSKLISEPDQNDSSKQTFERAEKALDAGQKEEAMAGFEKVRKETGKGMLYVFSTQYLAFLKFELGQIREAYDLLLPLRAELSSDALCLLHRIAFELKNYSLVLELSGHCFQNLPSAENALRNAYACAALSQPTPAVGWLETAKQEGLENLPEIIKESIFDPIRDDPSFKKLTEN